MLFCYLTLHLVPLTWYSSKEFDSISMSMKTELCLSHVAVWQMSTNICTIVSITWCFHHSVWNIAVSMQYASNCTVTYRRRSPIYNIHCKTAFIWFCKLINSCNQIYLHSPFSINKQNTETAVLKVLSDILWALWFRRPCFVDPLASISGIRRHIPMTTEDVIRTWYSLDACVLSWFMSYLNSCSQFVHCPKSASLPTDILCGVRQGSVLGLIQFLLYTADLQSNLVISKLTG